MYLCPTRYTIMKMCWNLEPTERPTFSEVSQLIERLLGEQPERPDQVTQTGGWMFTMVDKLYSSYQNKTAYTLWTT